MKIPSCYMQEKAVDKWASGVIKDMLSLLCCAFHFVQGIEMAKKNRKIEMFVSLRFNVIKATACIC